jgi:hypothetical protein
VAFPGFQLIKRTLAGRTIQDIVTPGIVIPILNAITTDLTRSIQRILTGNQLLRTEETRKIGVVKRDLEDGFLVMRFVY